MRENKTPICIAEPVLRVVRSRWSLTLIRVIADGGPIHFSAIGRQIPGISSKVLTDQLRNLQRDGVLQRMRAAERQEVYYELSNRGWELKRALDGLSDLARRWGEL